MSRSINLLRACRDIRRTQSLDREGLLAVQEQRWRGLLRHALAASPFYRRRLAGLDPEHCALSDIPPLTKAELLAHWDDIVTDPRLHRAELTHYIEDPANWGRLFHGRWMVSESSGTSGSVVVFPLPVEALDRMHAAHFVRRGATNHGTTFLPRWPLRARPTLVSIACVRGPCASSGIFLTRPWIASLFQHHHQLDASGSWTNLLQSLNRIQPDIMNLFASVLACLAQAQLAGDLHLDFSHPAAAISTGGDTLTPGIRALCKEAFGIEPLNGYGATETMGLARQWRGTDNLVLFEDLVAFEAVDVAERPVAEGELADHVLVTPLFNRDVPLLRYRLDDRVRPGPVQPGWPFRSLLEIGGRTAMTFVFRTPDSHLINGMDLMGSWYADPRLVYYQLRQLGPAEVRCSFIPRRGSDVAAITRELSSHIRSILDQAGCHTVRCEAVPVDALDKHPRSGKIERYMPMDVDGRISALASGERAY